ncbi:MAG: META domain-containing protein [Pyrinomonadaceae bacterium]
MIRNFKILIGMLAVTMMAATGAFSQNAGLASRHWELTELHGDAVGGTKAYIEISPDVGRFNGNAGCNRMFGAVKAAGRKINFSGTGTTRMMCDEQAMKIEGEFTKTLEHATRYMVSGDTMRIYTGNRVAIKFKAGPDRDSVAANSIKLEDKKWVLEAIAGKAAGPLGEKAFISFNAKKQAAGGDTSCNAYGGDYTAKGNTISITQIISTMRACIEDDRMNIERSFLDGLRDADRFEIKDGKLFLYKKKELLLSFRGEKK